MTRSFTIRRSGAMPTDVVEDMLANFELYLNANHSGNTDQLAVNLGTLGAAADGVLGASNSVGTDDPTLLPLHTSPYAFLPTVASNTLSIPDAAALDITGNVTLRIAFAPDDATPAGASQIVMKGTSWTAAGVNYGLGISTGGNLVFRATDSGNTLRTWTSSVALWTTDGAPAIGEASLNVATGEVTFRQKTVVGISTIRDDTIADTGWTALGTAQTATVTGSTLAANSSALVVGVATGGTAGKLYYAEVRDGSNNTVASFDPSAAANDGATSWTTAQGATLTVNRSTTGRKLALVTNTAKWSFDGSDYIEIADQSALDIGAGESLTAFVLMREFANQSTSSALISKQDSTGNTAGWRMQKSAAGSITSAIGNGSSTVSSTAGTGVSAANAHLLAVTFNSTHMRVWVDGVAAAATSHGGVSFANSLALRIGRQAGSGTAYFTGEIVAVGIARRTLSDTEIQSIYSYFTGAAFGGSAGDYLRPFQDVSSALRGDGFSSAPQAPANVFFTAAPLSYTSVKLDWGVGGIDDVDRVQIVKSLTGHPVTPLDGRSVVSVGGSDPLYTFTDNSSTPGRWHYYSLFVRVDDGSNIRFERVAIADCLVPFNYASTDWLFQRVPLWYREQDGDGGDLYRFLNLFGYELDYVRTLIEHVRDVRDPLLVPVHAMYAAGRQLGIPQVLEGLSETRYRSLLTHYMYLNSEKGTLAGIRQYLSVITGSRVDVTQIAANNIEIRIYAQRTNLIREPQANGTLWTESTSGDGSVGYSNGVVQFTGGAGGGDASTAMADIPVEGGREYSFGALVLGATAGVTFEVNYTVTDGAPSAIGATGTLPLKRTFTTGQQRVETVPHAMPTGASEITLEIATVLPASGSVTLRDPIFEEGAVGEYFDGDTRSGGFLPGSSGIQDFRWGGSTNASVSYYTLNYGVTTDLVLQVLQYIVPVGVKVGSHVSDLYEITDFNMYSGKP